jgi:D-alanyl-D-alanine carboxypeptidase (penicillin-binding protein 5/6)
MARALLTALVSVSMLLAPARALGVRYETDKIAGVTLEESGLETVAPDIDAVSGLIITPDGRILWSRLATNRRAMASITKIMTALIVLEEADIGETVKVSEAASEVAYATGLLPGERLTVRQLLELALVASSNDAAIALAEHVGGSERVFVNRMNERARELGLEDMHFANPHGLDGVGHHSSAVDIASLTHTAMRIPEFREIVALEEITLPSHEDRPAETIESTDELLGTYGGLFGVKTGFTDDAKYSFVGAAERDGIVFTTVILGARSNPARFENTARLLDWGFEHLKMQTIATATETVGVVPISVNTSCEVPVGFAETTATPVFDLDGETTRTVSLDSSVDLPVYLGQPLGEIEVRQAERLLATLPVVAAEAVASAEETVGAVPVSDYLDRTVVARATGESLPVPAFDPDVTIQRTIMLNPQIAAPVEEGDLLGEITYSQSGEIILSVPAVAAESIEAPGTIAGIGIWFTRAWRRLLGEPTMALLQIAGP